MDQQPQQQPPPLPTDFYGVNLQQLFSAVRTLVPFIGGILVARGVMNATQFDSLINQLGTIVTDVTVLIGAVAPVATMVWGMIKHTNVNVVKEAAQVRGVKVRVADDAPADVKAIAADPAQPNVTQKGTKP